MVRRRACDGCSLRKTRCSGGQPCQPCVQSGFECSYLKPAAKPGPKGPRAETYMRINRRLQSIRDRAPRGATETASPANVRAGLAEAADSSRAIPAFEVAGDEQMPFLTEWPSQLPLADVLGHLEAYEHRMYPVWPVVDVARLRNSPMLDVNNDELRSLAFAVCAATCAQLQCHPDNRRTQMFRVGKCSLADHFAKESEYCRSMYDYRESGTFEAVLGPLFLHFYYGATNKMSTASLLLRESVTLCQLQGLDREDTYQGMAVEEETYRRRALWLLYVTERGHAIQHGINTCLKGSIRLPTRDCANECHLVEAFDSLVGLFISVEGVLLEPGGSPRGPNTIMCSKDMLCRLQSQLRQRLQWPTAYHALQRTDIAITQQWLRVLLWQLSLKNIFLSSASADDCMRLTYPVHVARDAIVLISNVPQDTFMAHGPGMAIKLFEITSTLLDVIHCVPSLVHRNPAGTYDILHHLCYLLSSLSHRPFGLELLQKKLDESGIPYRRIVSLSPAERDDSPVIEPLNDEELDSW
ncbi:aflYd/ sugR/ sugar regulator [Aspergillus flavus]|nr:aflYd/ sugR/ sugar regulator [Aspergillus flavus]